MRDNTTYAMVAMLWEGKPWRQHIQPGKIMRNNRVYPWLQCCGRENHGASTSNREKLCVATEYIHGYNAVGGKTMAPAQAIGKNYT